MTIIYVVGFLALAAFWQWHACAMSRCARRNAAFIAERDRQFHELIRERDRLYNAEIWARDRRIAELYREIERLTGTMKATQLAPGTFAVTNADGETRTFSGSLDSPAQQAAAINAMRQPPPERNSD